MYVETLEGLGQSQRVSDCSGWERDPQSFSKVIAEHYVRTELGRPLRGERILCRPDGRICEVSFPGDTTVQVSLVKVPEYVIARQVYTRAVVPRREYSYRCTPRGDVILSPRKQTHRVPRRRKSTSTLAPTREGLGQAVAASDVVRAVRLNRRYAQSLGWQSHIDRIGRLLGFTTPPNERTFAEAVAKWQQGRGLPADGVIGPTTWFRLCNVLSRGSSSAESEKKTIAGTYSLSEVIGDSVAEIGQMLWKKAPAGVMVAIYDPDDPELNRRAVEWAKREDAIGVKKKKIDATELTSGKAIADSGNLASQLTRLGAALKTAVEKAQPPQGVTPLPGTGPQLVRTLALFTHGTNTWIGIGGGITTRNVATVIRSIAPALTVDIKIIIYGCSAARGTRERPGDWRKSTMEPGGEDSLAAKVRDALVDEGKLAASVWSHTEVGHTTRNPSLRFFEARDGKGAKGRSYVEEYVFGTVERVIALGELEETIRDLGFTISDNNREKFSKLAYEELRRLMYDAYVNAVVRTARGKQVRITNLTYRGSNLPEMAPLYPLDVSNIIQKHWSEVYWSKERKESTAKKLLKKLGLKR